MMAGWMWGDVYGYGWMLGCVGWIGGGLEEGCRSIGGALEEDGPPKYGLGMPQYGDYVATSWKNDIFFVKMTFFVNFSFRAFKLLANHEEQLLTFLGFLPPYFGVSRSLA